MAIMLGDVTCSNEGCKKKIDFHQEGMQYANCKYKVACKDCGETTTFSGGLTHKHLGTTLDDTLPEAIEIEG